MVTLHARTRCCGVASSAVADVIKTNAEIDEAPERLTDRF